MGFEVDHSSPTSAKLKRVCIYTSTPSYVLMGQGLVKQRDNFTYIFNDHKNKREVSKGSVTFYIWKWWSTNVLCRLRASPATYSEGDSIKLNSFLLPLYVVSFQPPHLPTFPSPSKDVTSFYIPHKVPTLTPPYLSWPSHLLSDARCATARSASCHFPWCTALVKLSMCSQKIQAWESGSCGNLSLAFSNTTAAKLYSP
jgi:hypothetical protein